MRLNIDNKICTFETQLDFSSVYPYTTFYDLQYCVKDCPISEIMISEVTFTKNGLSKICAINQTGNEEVLDESYKLFTDLEYAQLERQKLMREKHSEKSEE